MRAAKWQSCPLGILFLCLYLFVDSAVALVAELTIPQNISPLVHFWALGQSLGVIVLACYLWLGRPEARIQYFWIVPLLILINKVVYGPAGTGFWLAKECLAFAVGAVILWSEQSRRYFGGLPKGKGRRTAPTPPPPLPLPAPPKVFNRPLPLSIRLVSGVLMLVGGLAMLTLPLRWESLQETVGTVTPLLGSNWIEMIWCGAQYLALIAWGIGILRGERRARSQYLILTPVILGFDLVAIGRRASVSAWAWDLVIYLFSLIMLQRSDSQDHFNPLLRASPKASASNPSNKSRPVPILFFSFALFFLCVHDLFRVTDRTQDLIFYSEYGFHYPMVITQWKVVTSLLEAGLALAIFEGIPWSWTLFLSLSPIIIAVTPAIRVMAMKSVIRSTTPYPFAWEELLLSVVVYVIACFLSLLDSTQTHLRRRSKTIPEPKPVRPPVPRATLPKKKPSEYRLVDVTPRSSPPPLLGDRPGKGAGAERRMQPLIEKKIADHFEGFELIGEGVSAKVYRAVEKATGGVVALKLLNPHLQRDDVSVERFRREIQITRHLQHPRIISMYDLFADEGRLYLMMEYLDGLNLKDFIRVRTPLPVEEVTAILTDILEVLSLCHSKNVIHRDLKPQNIIVTREYGIKLLDFGIARMTALSDLTQTGTSLGSPEYMAPELFASNSYDPRTDIYALGVISFEMLTGRPPFQDDALSVLYQKHREAPVPPISGYREDVPPWLEKLVGRMLAKRGFERYQCADEVLMDLRSENVIATEIPSLPARECVACGGPTPRDLPVCTSCGHSSADTFLPGGCAIFLPSHRDPAKLDQFFRKTFDWSLPPLGAGEQLLVSGIDAFAGETLKRAALRHGVYLELKPSLTSHPIRARVITSTLFISSALMVEVLLFPKLVSNVPGAIFPWVRTGAMRGDLGGVIAMVWLPLVAIISICTIAYRRQRRLPILSNPSSLQRPLQMDFGWLKDLKPRLSTKKTEAMRALLASLVEKYYLLMKSIPTDAAPMHRTVRDVLQVMGDATTFLSELETAVSGAPVTAWAEQYARVITKLDSGEDRGSLAEKARLEAKLRDYYSLEERYQGLTNRMIYLQYIFNSLLGKIYAFQSPLLESDVNLLAQAITKLDEELAIHREVAHELEQAA